MVIDLNEPGELTLENVRRLIASGDDRFHLQIRVTEDGLAFLSYQTGPDSLVGLAFRLETYSAGNGYVGEAAAADEEHVRGVLISLRDNWPKPTSSYVDF